MICEICGKEYNTKNSFSRHISSHMTQEEYFNKYLRTSSQEGKCFICGKPTRFRNFSYANCCSQSCRNTWINQNRTIEERIELSNKISKTHKTIETKEKTKNTNIKKYGVPFTTQNSKVQAKRKQTCLEKYGTECSWQAEEVKQKIQKSIYNHYGEAGLSSKEVREKKIKTCQERYNTNNPGQVESIKNKIKQTTKQHYGTEYAFQAAEVKAKIKQTNLNKYGVENVAQSKEIYEKIKQTNLIKYGVTCQYQRKDLREKLNDEDTIKKKYETKHRNKSFNSSKPEEECYLKLLTLFDKVERSYKSKVYPFECDFYIPKLDLYIECNFFWTHGGHFFNANDPNDIAKVEKWKAKNSKFYNNAIVNWTIRDINKLNTAISNNINYLVCWTKEDFMKIFSQDFNYDNFSKLYY